MKSLPPLIRQTSREIIQVLTSEDSAHDAPISMGEYVNVSAERLPLVDEFLSPEDLPHSSILAGSVFTLTNTILGSGTLAVPYAISCSGWVVGELLMLGIALVTRYSARLLLQASDLAGPGVAKTYEGLGHASIGLSGTYLAEFTFIFGGFGTLVSYFIFISHLFCTLFGWDIKTESWKVMASCVVGVILPLSLNRRIGHLRLTSFCATLAVAYVVGFAVMVYCRLGPSWYVPGPKPEGTLEIWENEYM